ncbi:hypothetical protein GCM10027605_00870 [Micromonospora zhanjiangensis]
MTTELAERAWCVVVPHQPRGARTARRRLSTELALVVSPALLADVVATVAELVGNSVRHADPLPGAVIRVAWRLRPGPDTDTVEVRVTDGGAATGVPRLREAGPDSLDGRGLHIVAALAVEWGLTATASARASGPASAPPSASPGHRRRSRARHGPLSAACCRVVFGRGLPGARDAAAARGRFPAAPGDPGRRRPREPTSLSGSHRKSCSYTIFDVAPHVGYSGKPVGSRT